MSREWSHKSRWSLAAVLIVVAVMTLSSIVAGAALGGTSVAGAVSASTPITPTSHSAPAATNTGTTSTDLGGNTVPVGGSVGVTLPNAIPSNYTRPVPLELSAFTYSPLIVFSGEGVWFVTGVTTGGVPPYSSSWTFWDSAGTQLGPTQYGDSANYTFPAAGNYTVFNNIRDGVGNTGSWNETITVYAPLKISVTAPSTVTTNSNVTLSYAITGGSGFYCLNWTGGYAMSSPYGGNSCPAYPTLPVGFTGVPATGTKITHYPYPGTYQPTFVVTDAKTSATSESAFYINVENGTTSAIVPPLGGVEYTSIYNPTVAPTAPYASPIQADVPSMPMTNVTDIVVQPTGGSGLYTVTVVWGDGAPNTAATFFGVNPAWGAVPGYYATHVWNTPAIYQIAIFVNDSLGSSEKFVNVLTVTYVAPTVQLGYLTDNGASNTLPHMLANTKFSSAPSDILNIRISVDRAEQGIIFWGSLFGGESPFTGSLSNATVPGIQTVSGFSVPGSCDFFDLVHATCYTNVSGSSPWVRGYVFATNVPGTYHFTLQMTDNVGNLAGASLIITVYSNTLSVQLDPLSTTISTGSGVTFTATIYNVSIPAASRTGQQNVTFTFYKGFGTAPTYGAYGDSHAAGFVSYLYTGPPGSTQCSSGCPVSDAGFTGLMPITYGVAGTFYANATVNYGLGFNDTTAVPSDDYFVSTSVISVTAHPITVYWTTIPYPPDVYTGQSVTVTAHISGGNGLYSMYLKAGNDSRVWISDPTESLCTTVNATGPSTCMTNHQGFVNADQNTTMNAMVNNTAYGYYPSNSTFYYNITWFVWYPSVSTNAPGGIFGHYTYARDPGYSSFNLTGVIDIRVSAPPPLSVSLVVSEFSYAGNCYFPQLAADYPAGQNMCAASGTHWTAYLNISGSVGPYETSIFWSMGPGSIFAPLVNLTGTGPGITDTYCSSLGGNFTGTTCNYPTGAYNPLNGNGPYFVGSFAVFLTAPAIPVSAPPGTQDHLVFSGVYVSPSSSLPAGDYINAEHAIQATVTAEGQTFPVFGHPTQTVVADTYGIPYIETSLILSESSVVIPNDIAAVAPTFFGEYPNLQQYTYFWELVNDSSGSAVSFQNTTSDVARFYVPAGGSYTIDVTATSTISGEMASTSADFTAVVAPPLVEVIGTHAQVTLDRVAPTSPPPNVFSAFAGDVYWGADGTVTLSFAMPGANFTVNSVYTMDVTFSYTLGITVFDSWYYGGSWQTYFYNVYKPDYYSATLNVLAQGTLSNVTGQLAKISQQIGNLNNTVTVSTATLASLVANGFATVNNGLLTIYDQGAAIEATLATVNATVQSISSTAIYLNTTLGTVSTTLSGIQATLSTINGNVMTLTTDVGTLTTTVNGMAASIATIKGNTVTIMTDLGAVQATLASINTTVTTTASGVTSLLGSMVTVKTDLGTLMGTVTAIQGTVASIQTTVGTMNMNVSSIQSSVGTIQSNTNQVTTYFIIVIVLVIIAIVVAVLAVVRVNSVARRLEETMGKSGGGSMGGSSGEHPPGSS